MSIKNEELEGFKFIRKIHRDRADSKKEVLELKTKSYGTMSQEEWIERCYAAIKKSGKEKLLNTIISFLRNFGIKCNEQLLKEFAMIYLIREDYKKWKGFSF